jgi:hypothetical protein
MGPVHLRVVQRTGAAPGLRHLGRIGATGAAQPDWRNRILRPRRFAVYAFRKLRKRFAGNAPGERRRWMKTANEPGARGICCSSSSSSRRLRAEPIVAGIPFFYWFQLALVLVSAVVTAVVYFATESSRNG